MTDTSSAASEVLGRLQKAREKAGISAEELAEDLILGPGWIERFETGQTVPDIDTLLVLIERIGIDPASLFRDLQTGSADASPAEMNRMIRGEQQGDNLLIHFRYANFDATYLLKGATVSQFEQVLKALRDELSRLVLPRSGADNDAIKTGAVAVSFLKAIQLWPEANPSDLWWFIVYRAYLDPYNHPAQYARMSFDQSWKRTGGWALEEILVRHYAAELASHGISIEIATGPRKEALLSQLTVRNRLEPDKVDVVLVGPGETCFGVIHVKSSFAERRSDDVPMSEALVDEGYCSPLWTMDCKSTPGPTPVNRGELGPITGKRSAKRKDIEDDGFFSACFSYNRNTKSTPANVSTAARIYVCDFSHANDDFVNFIVESWEQFRQKNIGR